MCGASFFRSKPLRNSFGSSRMNSRAFQNKDLGAPRRSTYSSLRLPKPITTPSFSKQRLQARAIAIQDTPDSRDLAVTPGRLLRQESNTQSIHSICFGNKINGITVGRLDSALRGSEVMPQSIINWAG